MSEKGPAEGMQVSWSISRLWPWHLDWTRGLVPSLSSGRYRRSSSEEMVTGARLRHHSRRQSLPEAGARRIYFEESALLELQLEVS